MVIFDSIYLINKGELTEIKKPVFSTGDAYVVVDKPSKKVYVWLGSKCSVDEKGSGAAQARTIDKDQFNGAAKVITYDEGDESKEFLAGLQGLRIVNKNLAESMLKDVTTGEFSGQAEHINALYKVSSEEFEGGIDAIKYVQVPFEKASLDPDDVMIADMGVDIWVWQGKECNVKEKVKAIQLARELDADRAGAQTPKVFMQDDGDGEFLGLFDGSTVLKQDRETTDLKLEKFDDKKEEPKPEPKEEPKPEPKPEPKESAIPKAQEMKKEETGGMMWQEDTGRNKCPKCGNDNSYKIKETVDRNHIIMPYPVMYGKKLICGVCGGEWKRRAA